MGTNRKIGYNISLLLDGNPISDLANGLNLTEYDVRRILDGRVFVNPDLISKIANFFNVEPSEVYRVRSNDEYKGMIHCMSEFSDTKNQEFILDMMDSYVDLMEI